MMVTHGYVIAEYNLRNGESIDKPRCYIGPCDVDTNVEKLVKKGKVYSKKDAAVSYAMKRMNLGYMYGERDIVLEYPSMKCVWMEGME